MKNGVLGMAEAQWETDTYQENKDKLINLKGTKYGKNATIFLLVILGGILTI
ncbi:hypothetical protein P4S72_08735 [Vibrio sp. PP-XX7]